MAREVIESVHVPWDVVNRINLKSQGRGRVYRIAPDGFKARPPRLGAAGTGELVATLAHRNGWWRDAARHLLRERQDAAAIEPLRRMLHGDDFDLARLHALYTLSQLNALADADLLAALADKSPGVREHGVRLAESRLSGSDELLSRVAALADDESPRGTLSGGVLAGRSDRARVGRWANGCSASQNRPARRRGPVDSHGPAQLGQGPGRGRVDRAHQEHTQDQPAHDVTLLRQLGFLVGRDENHDSAAASLLGTLAEASVAVPTADLLPILLGLNEGLRGSGTSLRELRPHLSEAARALVDRAVAGAAAVAANREAAAAVAIRRSVCWAAANFAGA